MRNGNNGGGLYAYQVMFLLEGFLTLVVAITTFWWLPLGPRSAWWLQQSDREWAEKRVLLDRAGADQDGEHRRGLAGGEEEEGEELLRDGEEEEVDVIVAKSTVGGEGALTRRDVEEAFRDWKIWWILALNIASSVPGAAFSVFLPLVIKVSLLQICFFRQHPMPSDVPHILFYPPLTPPGYGSPTPHRQSPHNPALPLWRLHPLGYNLSLRPLPPTYKIHPHRPCH